MRKRTPRAVKAVSSMLNFGSPKPPVDSVPLGLDTCWICGLRKEKLVDLSAQGNVFPAGDFLSDHFESERSIADPSVEIVWVDGVRAGDDDSGLMGEDLG
jgi:hypothetical protein